MRKLAKAAIGVAAVCTIAHLVVHRRAIKAHMKGDPLPDPPEWHKKFHPCMKG